MHHNYLDIPQSVYPFSPTHNCLWVFCDDRVWLFNQVVQRPSACLASGSRYQSIINLTVLTVLTALLMMWYTPNNISQTIDFIFTQFFAFYFLSGADSQSRALLCCRVQYPRRFSKCSISDYKEFLWKGGGSCLFNRPNKVRGDHSASCFQCIFIPSVMSVCIKSCVHKQLSCIINLVLHTITVHWYGTESLASPTVALFESVWLMKASSADQSCEQNRASNRLGVCSQCWASTV